VNLGSHTSVTNTVSLVADVTARIWRGHTMFMADLSYIKTNVKCKLFKQDCCSYCGVPL